MSLASTLATSMHADAQTITRDLKATLQPWRSFLIAIDGRDGVGKSSLGRLLAWKLQVPLIETDLYLVQKSGEPTYHLAELQRVVRSRLSCDRPVMIEGIFIRRLAESLGFNIDCLIHVTSSEYQGSAGWRDAFKSYETKFQPASANYQVQWPVNEAACG